MRRALRSRTPSTFFIIRLKNPQKIVDSKTAERLCSGILATVAACARVAKRKLNPRPPGRRSEDREDGKKDEKHLFTNYG